MNAGHLRRAMQDANVDVVTNADQTFVLFHPKKKQVVAPQDVKHVGGKMKSNNKTGFTLMVTLELRSSEMMAPSIVHIGKKSMDAERPRTMLWHKFQNWCNLSRGCANIPKTALV